MTDNDKKLIENILVKKITRIEFIEMQAIVGMLYEIHQAIIPKNTVENKGV